MRRSGATDRRSDGLELETAVERCRHGDVRAASPVEPAGAAHARGVRPRLEDVAAHGLQPARVREEEPVDDRPVHPEAADGLTVQEAVGLGEALARIEEIARVLGAGEDLARAGARAQTLATVAHRLVPQSSASQGGFFLFAAM